MAQQPTDVASWFQQAATTMAAGDRRRSWGAILYKWWNIWKEHNTRIFQGQERNQLQVTMLTKEEMDGYSFAKLPTPLVI